MSHIVTNIKPFRSKDKLKEREFDISNQKSISWLSE